MKKILFAILALSICVSSLDAQTARRKKPKKPKGNHSNEQLQNGFASISAMMFDMEESSVASGDVPGSFQMSKPILTGGTLMTPTGWGSNKTFAFVTTGGTPSQSYLHTPDMLAQVGFGTGNSKKFISVAGCLNINDVTKFNNYSASFVASRALWKNTSVSVGALHLFADAYITDAGPSYYTAFSQAFPKARLAYTVGVGTGRFYDNTQWDMEDGKAPHGTAIFGNLTYNVSRNVNVGAEWTGLNLGTSASFRIKPNWPVVSVGVKDLLRTSSDKPAFLFSMAHAFVFNKKGK